MVTKQRFNHRICTQTRSESRVSAIETFRCCYKVYIMFTEMLMLCPLTVMLSLSLVDAKFKIIKVIGNDINNYNHFELWQLQDEVGDNANAKQKAPRSRGRRIKRSNVNRKQTVNERTVVGRWVEHEINGLCWPKIVDRTADIGPRKWGSQRCDEIMWEEFELMKWWMRNTVEEYTRTLHHINNNNKKQLNIYQRKRWRWWRRRKNITQQYHNLWRKLMKMY